MFTLWVETLTRIEAGSGIEHDNIQDCFKEFFENWNWKTDNITFATIEHNDEQVFKFRDIDSLVTIAAHNGVNAYV